MSIAVDERSWERVVLGWGAFGGHPQDLPGECVDVLGGVALPGVAGGGVEHPVGFERDPPAVVIAGGRDSLQDRFRGAECEVPWGAVEREALDAVPLAPGRVDVEALLFVDRDAEEPGLAAVDDVVDGAHDPGGVAGELEDVAGVAFADEGGVAVGRDRPGGRQVSRVSA